MPPVLLVDDDAAVRRTIARFLTFEGFAVVEASNGLIASNLNGALLHKDLAAQHNNHGLFGLVPGGDLIARENNRCSLAGHVARRSK